MIGHISCTVLFPLTDVCLTDVCVIIPPPTLYLLIMTNQASACGLIVLTNGKVGAYALEKEIVVSRPVVIMGHPVIYPYIDAHAKRAERAFRVTVSKQDIQ